MQNKKKLQKCFILPLTTIYLQRVLNMLRMFCNFCSFAEIAVIFATFYFTCNNGFNVDHPLSFKLFYHFYHFSTILGE